MNNLVSRQPQGLEASIRDRLNIGRPPMEDPVEEYLYVNVADPHKVGEGMSSYMAYKVMTRTNLRCFRRGSFTVVRRYSDFLGLHEKLVARYQSKGRIIPPAPEKNIIGETILFNHPCLLLKQAKEFCIIKTKAMLKSYLSRVKRIYTVCFCLFLFFPKIFKLTPNN